MSVSIQELSSPGDPVSSPSLDSAGDEAFERLHTDYRSLVERVVRRYLWGAVVDDTVQETFVQAYRSRLHLRRDDGDRRTAKRLAAIARNRSVDVLRKRMRGLEEVADDGRLASLAAAASETDPELHLQAARRREGIAEAVDTLCDRQRRVLLLRHVAGHPYDEIARIEGISVDAVKASLARGRRAFRLAYAAIAERRGLSVLPGFGMLRRLHTRLRLVGRRAVEATQEAIATFAAASPAITQGVVAAVVVGSVAVAGAGLGPSPASAEPVGHSSEGPADQAGEESAGEESPGQDEGGNRGSPQGEQQAPESSESPPSDPPESAGGQSGDAPPKANVEHETSAEADSDEVAGDESPASARAEKTSRTKADTEKADAGSEQESTVEAAGTLSEAGVDHVEYVGVGCESGKDDAVKDSLCPVVSGEEDPATL